MIACEHQSTENLPIAAIILFLKEAILFGSSFDWVILSISDLEASDLIESCIKVNSLMALSPM